MSMKAAMPQGRQFIRTEKASEHCPAKMKEVADHIGDMNRLFLPQISTKWEESCLKLSHNFVKPMNQRVNNLKSQPMNPTGPKQNH